MQVIQPTPSQAAVVLKNFLSEKGIQVPLNLAQEAIARTKGYASYQALAKNEPLRGIKNAKVSEEVKFPQLQLWSLIGRVSGDDDDTGHLLWAKHEAEAQSRFESLLAEEDGSKNPTIFVISREFVGKYVGNEFQLSKPLQLEPEGKPVSVPALPSSGKSMAELWALWKQLGDIPTAPESTDEVEADSLEEAFLHFGVGTPREDVWHWFEEQNKEFCVGDVMCGLLKPPKVCHRCDMALDNQGYCSDVTCVYNNWPQYVKESLMYGWVTESIEKEYGIRRRNVVSSEDSDFVMQDAVLNGNTLLSNLSPEQLARIIRKESNKVSGLRHFDVTIDIPASGILSNPKVVKLVSEFGEVFTVEVIFKFHEAAYIVDVVAFLTAGYSPNGVKSIHWTHAIPPSEKLLSQVLAKSVDVVEKWKHDLSQESLYLKMAKKPN